MLYGINVAFVTAIAVSLTLYLLRPPDRPVPVGRSTSRLTTNPL